MTWDGLGPLELTWVGHTLETKSIMVAPWAPVVDSVVRVSCLPPVELYSVSPLGKKRAYNKIHKFLVVLPKLLLICLRSDRQVDLGTFELLFKSYFPSSWVDVG